MVRRWCGGKNIAISFVFHIEISSFRDCRKKCLFLMSGRRGQILFVFNRFVRSVRCNSRGFPLLNLPPHVSDGCRRNEVLFVYFVCFLFIVARRALLRHIKPAKTRQCLFKLLIYTTLETSGNTVGL